MMTVLSPRQLILATTNRGKIAELRILLARHLDLTHLQLVAPDELTLSVPEVEENGATFAENAILKACAFAAATGSIALADDSGLCVDALGGAPGVLSARWAGPTDHDRIGALLAALQGVPASQRTARFVCVMAAARPDGTLLVAEGGCTGMIAETPSGSSGFGYDPIFYVPEARQTLAEMSGEKKNQISHRAAALAQLSLNLRKFIDFTGDNEARERYNGLVS